MLATESLLPCDTSLNQSGMSSHNSASGGVFKFPPPPSVKSESAVPSSPYVMSTSDIETNSDTSAEDYVGNPSGRSRAKKVSTSNSAVGALSLPPIGVFWDIENCQIPRGRSALSVAQNIRDNFFEGYREVEFVVVCDVKKENAQIIQELNDAQVNLIHVSSTCKNAADAKLRQSIRRFADIHAAPAAIILISGDVNFAADLSDLRHRKKIHVILLHNDRCSDSLILCASEHHDYTALVSNLPLRGTTNKVTATGPAEVLVSNLPIAMDHSRIRNRLKRLAENCGGRVGVITDYATTIRFPNYEFALRCQKRIDQEMVFGSKIHVGPPMLVQASPARYGGPYQRQHHRRHYNSEGEYDHHVGYRDYNSRESGYASGNNQENIQDPTANFHQWNSENNKSSFQHYHHNGAQGGAGRPVLGVNNTAPNGNIGHFCKSSKSTAQGHSLPGGSHSHAQSQPITILKRTSPLPHNFVLNIDTSIPPPPIVNVPQSGNGSSVTNGSANERYFHPITSSSLNTSGGPHNSSPVELHVTNLDQGFEPTDLKRILAASFNEVVSSGVLVSVFTQSDGTMAAAVKLRSFQDAQVAISQLHRKKIGFKRISISSSHSGAPYHSPTLIRSQIISLLQEVPKFKLPLFKFREMFEMRYSSSISVSELYKMKDVCTISEESNSRTIALNPDHRDSTTPSPVNRQNNSTPLLEHPYCTLHSRLIRHNSSISNDDKGWAELEASVLPNVKIPLGTFSEQVMNLIDTHSGALPLLSFVDCYEAQFDSLIQDEAGVPLEHLITCIRGVELVLNSYLGIKYLRKCDTNHNNSAGGNLSFMQSFDEGSNDTSPCVSPSLQGPMTLLCRELVDLLKTFPHCQMVFNKFIPAYHHHFGRQCRVADYGFTKLIDLLEAIPHVVQVMGEGSRRLITLSHRAQMRRFTSDLLRCLKSVPNKQCTLSSFPGVFSRVHTRAFDPVDYGLSSLQDLLANVSENMIVMSPVPGGSEEVMIAVPKREQTSDEIERTKKFSREVVEVLSHMPHYSILFNKFIPSYHHHYGHQCRVADFGFTKLIELFECIPDVVTIEDDIEDRRITLTIKMKRGVLLEQIKSLITLRSPVTLDNLNSSFSWQFGYPLRPSCYGTSTIEELMKKLEPNIKVQGRDLIIHEDNLIGLKVFRIFLENSNSKILLSDFINIYKKLYKTGISEEDLTAADDVVKVIRKNANDFVILTSLYLFAKDIYHLLYSCEGKISLGSLESMYLKMYGTAVQCAVYGHQSLSSLLGAISNIVTIKGKHKQKILILNRSLALVGIALPRETNNNSVGTNGEKCFNSGFRNRNNNSNVYGFKTYEEEGMTRRSSAHETGAEDFQPPVVHLPDFKIHPDTFTCSPLTSPYKGLPSTLITAPHPSTLPLPPF